MKGDGHIKVKPDTATLNLGVQATGQDSDRSIDAGQHQCRGLIAALKAGGVDSDDIATSGLSIYPQYNQEGVAVSAYQASNNVTVDRSGHRQGRTADRCRCRFCRRSHHRWRSVVLRRRCRSRDG